MTASVISPDYEQPHPGLGLRSPASSKQDVLFIDHGDRLVGVFLKLDWMRTLEGGWDSYGSPPPSDQLIDAAEAFVTGTDRQLRPFLPVPCVVPVSGGGIQFEWTNGSRELEIEFGVSEDGRLRCEFLRCSDGEPIHEGDVQSTEKLLGHLTWVVQG